MDLSSLGQDYLKTASCLKRCARQLYNLEKISKSKEKREIRRRINQLYSDAASCKKTGEHLINYYRFSSH